VTPYEVNDYLVFREEFYDVQGKELDRLPEQYLLGHFFSDANYDVFVEKLR